MNVENAKIDTQKWNVECRKPNDERNPKSECPTSDQHLGRSPELAARVRNLLDDLQQHTRYKRRCEELRRQLRRSLTRAKQELRRLLAQRGAVWTWFGACPRAAGKKTGRPL